MKQPPTIRVQIVTMDEAGTVTSVYTTRRLPLAVATALFDSLRTSSATAVMLYETVRNLPRK